MNTSKYHLNEAYEKFFNHCNSNDSYDYDYDWNEPIDALKHI